jgi:hypothetical protein
MNGGGGLQPIIDNFLIKSWDYERSSVGRRKRRKKLIKVKTEE